MPVVLELVVLNALGLHARPAAEFVRCAQRYPDTAICLRRGEEVFAADSILEILMGNFDQGTVFRLEADGPGAEAATQEMAGLLRRFKQEEEANP